MSTTGVYRKISLASLASLTNKHQAATVRVGDTRALHGGVPRLDAAAATDAATDEALGYVVELNSPWGEQWYRDLGMENTANDGDPEWDRFAGSPEAETVLA